MMRIGLGIDALAPQLTGIGRYTWELCRGLSAHSAMGDLSFYRFGRWFGDPAWFLHSAKPPQSLIPTAIRKLISKEKFKGRIFHSPNYFLPRHSERSIVTVHDLSVFRFPEMHPIERIRHFEREFGQSIAAAEHIITDSEFIRAELAEFANLPLSKISAVPLGVTSHFFDCGDRINRNAVLRRYGLAEDSYSLCVATLEPRKGLDQAIRAFTRHCELSRDDAKLVIIGATGWNNVELHQKIALGESAGRIKLLGYVAEEDLPALYAGACLFLYPSLYEGFGLPPIEAMASGVPTIVSDRSCLPEVTRGAAMLVNPDDVESFSAAIARGLGDDIWRSQAIQTGLRLAAGYTWDACVEKTVDVYRKVHREIGAI